MKQKKIHIPVVDPVTGEYMLLIKNKKESLNINSSKFIKFYFPFIDLMHLLSTSEIIIIQYICRNIAINKTNICITQDKTELKKSAFYESIKILTQLQIITKTKYQNIYELNKQMFFNGKY